ncbi:MAG: hypothetical protein FJ206_11335 [Gemmatimonadetes bacterium]|nr:hypothetical protein [Gemmatimonadota bacterium]
MTDRSVIGPLRFKLRIAGKDDFGGLDVVSITAKATGQATWEAGVLTIEWAEETRVEEVSFDKIRVEVIPKPPLALDIAQAEIADATLRGWWRPRLRLTPRYLGAFMAVPGATATHVDLFIARRDRPLAAELASACLGRPA